MGSEPLDVVGYVRVSTDEQARDGVSLEAQETKVRLVCQLHGLNLLRVFSDPGQSGSSLDRPGLRDALAQLDHGRAGGLVVAKLDRLTRSVRDLGTLLESYFGERPAKQLISAGDSIDTRTAAGRLVLNVLMSVAQWERETIVERTRDAIAHKRSKGERIGTIPYGYRLAADGRRLEEDAREQAAITHTLFAAGQGLSLREIDGVLVELGFFPRRGGHWSPSTLASILRRLT